jgi:hypothetical protein
MTRLKKIFSFMGSQTLTVWLLGALILYYLTAAVWTKEAFGTFITALGQNKAFLAVYAVTLLNITRRTVAALINLWPDKTRFFLRLPLYAGTILFLFSVIMSLNVRKSLWTRPVGEGDMIRMPWEQGALRIVRVEPALKQKVLRTDDSVIFDYEPAVLLGDDDRAVHRVGAFPPKRIGKTYLHILGFGIGPGVELKKNGRSMVRTYVALRLVPYGNTDIFELSPFPYRFHLSILPNRVIKKGRETARDYDLDQPLYRVEIVKGDKIIARGETDTGISFDGDMSLHFFKPSDWVLLDVAYDPFLPWFAAGLCLLVLGVVMYPISFLSRRVP